MKSILTIVIIAILGIACFSFTTNNNKNTYTLGNQITTDARFVSLLQDQYQTMNQVTDIETLANLDPDNINDSIDLIASQLGYSSTTTYMHSLVTKSNTLKELNDEYDLSSYSTDEIIEFGITALTANNGTGRTNRTIEISGEASEIDPMAIDDPCNCKIKKIACEIAATAAAVAGHLNCAPLNPISLAGLTCHGKVLIDQATAYQICNGLYIACIKNCK